jgi:hypothetical protein
VFRAGEPVVGRGIHVTAASGRAPCPRSADDRAVATLSRFDEGVQVGTVDEDAPQGLPLTIAGSRAKRRHVDRGDGAERAAKSERSAVSQAGCGRPRRSINGEVAERLKAAVLLRLPAITERA